MSLIDLIFPSSEPQVTNIDEFDYQQFSPENWSSLTDQEKLGLLQELGNSYAESVNIYNPPTFVSETDPTLYGGYNYGTNVVSVNLDLCDNPYEAMDTVIHEENHALQGQAVDLNSQYSNGERALIKAQIGPAYYSSGDGYNVQNIEMDSNNVAAEFVISHSEGMQDTPEYQEYIDGRLEHFSEVNETLTTSEGYCNTLEHEQVDAANKLGVISDSEKEAANAYIDSDNRRVRDNSIAAEADIKENGYQSSLAYADRLHSEYEQFEFGNHDERAAKSILSKNEECVDRLSDAKLATDTELADLKAQQNEYICAHNYGIRDTLNDSFCHEQNQKICELEAQKGEYEYHISELETDNHMVNESMGWTEKENAQTDNSQSESKNNNYEM